MDVLKKSLRTVFTLLSLSGLIFTCLHAQVQIPDRHLYINSGISGARLRDERLSPNVYRGLGIILNAGYIKKKQSIYQKYALDLFQSPLHNSASKAVFNTRMFSSGALATYTWQKYPGAQNPEYPFFRIGGMICMAGLQRQHSQFYNNSISHQFFSGAGVQGGLDYAFQMLRRDWELSVDAGLPLAGIISEPMYGYGGISGNQNQDSKFFPEFLQSLKPALPHHFLMIQYQWELQYKLRNRNYFSLGYHRQFIRHAGEGNLLFLQSMQQIRLGMSIQF